MKTPKPITDMKLVMKDIIESWKDERKRSDETLFYDRQGWLRDQINGGDIDLSSIPYEYDLDTNIASIGVMLSQIERFGGIVLHTKRGTLPSDIPTNTDHHLNEYNIMNEIDSEMVGNSFGMFCISRMDDNQIMGMMKEFKEMFYREVLKVNTNRIKSSIPNDEITQQTKEMESEKEVSNLVNRTHDDLTKMVMNMKLDKNSWKQSLRNDGIIQ